MPKYDCYCFFLRHMTTINDILENVLKNPHSLHITLSPLEGLLQHVGLAADRELTFLVV